VVKTINTELANAAELISVTSTKRASVNSIRLYKINKFLIFIYS